MLLKLSAESHQHSLHSDHEPRDHHSHNSHSHDDHRHHQHNNHIHSQSAPEIENPAHEDIHHHQHDHHEHGHRHSCEAEANFESSIGVEPPYATAVRDALLATTSISCASLFSIPLLPLLSSKENLAVGMSFAAGSLIADVMLHVLPHEFMKKYGQHSTHDAHNHEAEHGHGHLHNITDIWFEIREGMLLILGFIIFMLVAKVTRAFTDQAHRQKSQAQGLGSGAVLLLIADASHNFTDGLAVGAAFLVGPGRGAATALAVFFHELPHEVGDIAVLIGEGMNKWQAVSMQFCTAAGAMVGCMLGLLSGNLFADAGSVVGLISAGGFIYVATVTVIPQLMLGGFWQCTKEVIGMCSGVAMMVLILLLE